MTTEPTPCGDSERGTYKNHPLVLNVRRVDPTLTLGNYVYVGRPVRGIFKGSPVGNPFKTGMDPFAAMQILARLPGSFSVEFNGKLTREKAIECFRLWFMAQPELVAWVKANLRGKPLACWCAPKPCHADVVAEVANND